MSSVRAYQSRIVNYNIIICTYRDELIYGGLDELTDATDKRRNEFCIIFLHSRKGRVEISQVFNPFFCERTDTYQRGNTIVIFHEIIY